jgi:hypothetical protein
MNDLKVRLENTSIEFTKKIEDIVEKKQCSYIEAIVEYCKDNNLELETAGAIVKNFPKLKAKVRLEAEKINLVPKTDRLPE